MKYLLFSLISLLSLNLFSQSNLIISKSLKNDTSQVISSLIDSMFVDNQNLAFALMNDLGKPNPTENIEQTNQGSRPPAEIVASFDGLGYGFKGPQGQASYRNPSDNSLAVGRDHIVQIVNSRMAIFSKKGVKYDVSGQVLYGPVETKNVFRGFGGPCEQLNNGDAVVRYDQLADRWLIVMPIFTRLAPRDYEPPAGKNGEPATLNIPGRSGQPGQAEPLFIPDIPTLLELAKKDSLRRIRRKSQNPEGGSYCMCYAISTGPDPFGSYYRYEFARPLFPDYPRPAIWPDGYYVPTSTGDNIIQKHASVVEREEMLKGNPAKELSFIIDDVNFLNNADIDGYQLPPNGAANIMLATGGSQLNNIFTDDGIYAWKIKPDWTNPELSILEGPKKIEVTEYHYQGDGQLKESVPQPGTDQKLDTQGDKIMSRVIYRRIGEQQSIVAVHSVKTSLGGGGIRWYEFRLDDHQDITLFQQGTFAPDSLYRWLPSPAMDRMGNIGIGYSISSQDLFPGQRFTGRLAGDALGTMTLKEAVLVDGEASQTNTLRWEDYTQTAMDPSDDLTIWYVGDYLKKGSSSYSTRIGAFRLQKKRAIENKVIF